jgi:hypothetical protein
MAKKMPDDETETLRALCQASEARVPLADQAAVEAAFRAPGTIGVFNNILSDEIRTLLSSPARTGFDTHDLRRVRNGFQLENAIGQSHQQWDAVLDAILSALPAGTELHPLDNPAWPRAIDLARGLVANNVYRHPDNRTVAVAEAGRRLNEQGYRFAVQDGRFEFAAGELERATRQIISSFERLGQFNVLDHILRILKESDRHAFGMYLAGRSYGHWPRDPSIPFGFILNLATRLPLLGTPLGNGKSWAEGLNLARDVVAALDVEPYHQFVTLNPAPKRIEALLRELALFDHLFALRQWRFSDTALLLRNFFQSDHQHAMKENLGWDTADVMELINSVAHFAAKEPNVFTRRGLAEAGGMRRGLLDAMLPYFVHAEGVVNAGYVSPLSASDRDFNLMFKPLIDVGTDRLLLPCASLAGPAFYEATTTALRPIIGQQKTADLQGDGTERAMLALLRRANLNVTFVGAKYDLGPNDSGECDAVLESDTHIVLAETKAKALTRGAMAGVSGDALIDFGAALLASQAQALRHERLLRTKGSITFEDGRVLDWGRRDIVRLSLTLLDQGALQDRMVLWSLYDALRRAKLQTAPEYPKKGPIVKLNEALARMRYEVDALEAAGRSANAQKLATASLNIGQLAVLLENVTSLARFARRITVPITYMTFNPVFEFYHLQKSGQIT